MSADPKPGATPDQTTSANVGQPPAAPPAFPPVEPSGAETDPSLRLRSAAERDLRMPLAPTAPVSTDRFAPPDIDSPTPVNPVLDPRGAFADPPTSSSYPNTQPSFEQTSRLPAAPPQMPSPQIGRPTQAFGGGGPTAFGDFHPMASTDRPTAGSPNPPAANDGKKPLRSSWIGGVFLGSLIGAIVASLSAGAIYVASVKTDDAEVVTAESVEPEQSSRPPVTIAGEELDIGALLDKARPSVVTIRVDGGNFGEGTGSGIVIDDAGTILTNAHVISSAAGSSSAITIAFADGDVRPATLVGSFPDQDVALVRTTDPKETTPAELGSSDDLAVGDDVIAIGNALNLGAQPSVTKGIVSALNRELSAEGVQLDRLIQTDAAINPGNSGGALLNAFGQVVGVNTAIIQNSQSIGFALSIDSIKPLIEDIEAGNGAIDGDSPFLGVVTTNVSDQPEDVLLQFDVDVDAGAFIADIQAGTSAEIAKLQPGDVITEINGNTIETNEEVGEVIRELEPGDMLSITYLRGGSEQVVEVALGRRGG